MIAVLVASVLVIAGLLVVLDRQARRHHEQVESLLQRIQAPETAVLQHAAEVVPTREGPLFTNEYTEDEDALRDIFHPVEDR